MQINEILWFSKKWQMLHFYETNEFNNIRQKQSYEILNKKKNTYRLKVQKKKSK